MTWILNIPIFTETTAKGAIGWTPIQDSTCPTSSNTTSPSSLPWGSAKPFIILIKTNTQARQTNKTFPGKCMTSSLICLRKSTEYTKGWANISKKSSIRSGLRSYILTHRTRSKANFRLLIPLTVSANRDCSHIQLQTRLHQNL